MRDQCSSVSGTSCQLGCIRTLVCAASAVCIPHTQHPSSLSVSFMIDQTGHKTGKEFPPCTNAKHQTDTTWCIVISALMIFNGERNKTSWTKKKSFETFFFCSHHPQAEISQIYSNVRNGSRPPPCLTFWSRFGWITLAHQPDFLPLIVSYQFWTTPCYLSLGHIQKIQGSRSGRTTEQLQLAAHVTVIKLRSIFLAKMASLGFFRNDARAAFRVSGDV